VKIEKQTQTRASALILTLLTATIIGIALASYLVLVNNQNLSVARSLAWNSAIPVVESGVEEALTQIYYYGYTNLHPNNWTLGSDGLYHKSRVVGTDGSYWDATIRPVNPPVIESTGYVLAPLSPVAPVGMILGTVDSGQSTARYVSRKVRVTTRKARSVGAGLTAKGKISFSGGGLLDSFSSSDPVFSTNGKYDAAKRKSGGKALSNSSIPDAIHVDSAHIYGSAVTGPDGTVTTSSGSVGDAGWNSVQTGVQSGHSADDANVDFPDVLVPFTDGYSTPGSGSYGGTNFNWVVGEGNYTMNSINVSGGKSLVVTGKAVLYVPGDFLTSSTGFIYVAPGASLQLYVGGKFVVSGSGIVNGTDRADKLAVWGLNSCKTVSYSGNAEFIGTVYAPYAAFGFSGSAGACGAFTASTVSISGGASVHYDEVLTAGPGYIVASWNEI